MGKPMGERDENLLIDFFFVTVPAKRRRQAKTVYQFKGRKAHVERHGNEWNGWFADNHAMTYVAETKREVLADMQAEA
jgi:hypothetical protein